MNYVVGFLLGYGLPMVIRTLLDIRQEKKLTDRKGLTSKQRQALITNSGIFLVGVVGLLLLL